MKESMQKVRELEKQLFGYSYAMRVIDFDSETVAPEDGNDDGEGTAPTAAPDDKKDEEET